MRDETFMARALALAARAKGNTSPNPMVGAVIVAPDDAIVGTGFHERAGAPHAEAVALASAGDRARGATLFVTLEPCHVAGRTPPCAGAIAAAGISRVVVAMQDPDARERGTGIAELRAQGIEVIDGVLEEPARELNRMYVHQRETSRPFVTLKMAQSFDGAIAMRPGERQHLTGEKADRYVKTLRYEHDAVLVGIGTALIDDPQLTVRPQRSRAVPYTRIVVDSMARLPLKSMLVADRSGASTIVACTGDAPAERVRALEGCGVHIIRCKQAGGHVDLHDMLRQLGKSPMLGVLCEGGPTLASALMRTSLVDELQWLIAPVVFGAGAVPVLGGALGPAAVEFKSVKRLGDDLLVVARPRR
jgi:diaminohydroxyphosphoribosylaminopyrimidine deaminase / 5-amino-6-(5-phosphoribosylamino)uracil reductase